jgi:hypothetical protein
MRYSPYAIAHATPNVAACSAPSVSRTSSGRPNSTARVDSPPTQSAVTNRATVRGRTGEGGASGAEEGRVRNRYAVTASTISAVASTHDTAIAPKNASSAPGTSSAIFNREKTRFSSGTSVARLTAVST